MAKKKKKSKAGDARGYGQTTVFREAPKAAVAANEDNTTAKRLADTTNDDDAALHQANVDDDDWEQAFEKDRQATQALAKKQTASPVIKIPPPALVQLPTLAATATASSSTSQKKNPSTIVLSNTMYDMLQALVEPLPWQQVLITGQADAVFRTDRIVKKVAFLYDYLLVAGVSWDAVRQAVQALGSHGKAVDLKSVLDWLCYSRSSSLDDHNWEQLPARFLEGREVLWQEEARAKQQKSDDGVNDDGRTIDTPELDEKQQQDITTEPQLKNDATTGTADIVKDANPDVAPGTEAIATEQDNASGTDAELPDLVASNESTELPVLAKTKDEERLEELEKLFAEISFDVKDEASNYMRSKQEIKELETRHREVKKELQKLKGKVEKERERQKREELPAEAELSPTEDLFGGGGFFEEDEAQASGPTQESAVSTPSLPYIKVPKDAIPKSWTGKTPKEILEERCRRLKLPKPSFQKLDRNGCRIIIKGSIEVEEIAIFDSKMDGQHYVATKAIYQLDPTLPIYRSLPPYYHDLWKGWASEQQNAKDEKQKEEEELRRERILELISNAGLQEISRKETQDPGSIEEGRLNAEKAPSLLNSTPKRDSEDGRLQAEFDQRCTTKSYQTMLEQRKSLPIYGFRENILETVGRSPVSVLHAETGAGKTTQVAQFILERAFKDEVGGSTSILCTQPRRVAATSVAERVAEEMGTKLGDQVGYSIRLENRRSSQTRLLFCTTGVILRRLIEDPLLNGVSHVIVDEVHERQWQIDVLLVALRSLVNGSRRDLKIVLMSATLDAKLFCSFFHSAPLVSVPGRTFPVSSYFLEDLIEATGHIVEDDSPNSIRNYHRPETAQLKVTTKGGRDSKQTVSLDSEVDPTLSADYEGYSIETRRSMDRVDESVLNYDLIEDILHLLLIEQKVDHMLRPPEGQVMEKGAIIIFLPGIGEIRTLCDRLQASSYFKDRRTVDIIPLHSALSSTEQRRAFVVPRRVRWAIIVATNVAETSVTIPDAVCVIDSGRVREVRHDKRTLTRRLVTTWCSRASTKQRAGRAGRVQPGICLKLFSSRTSHRSMSPTTEPELQRLPLEEVCLTILAGGLAPGGCVAFLSQTPQPPKPDSVQAALLSLEQVGAIDLPPKLDDEVAAPVQAAEKLTPLGLHLARLPVDARLGKMLLLGVQFRCIDTITTIVAGLSASRNPFMSSLRDEATAQAKQAKFRHPDSDFMTYVNLYNDYIEAGETFSFCRDNYVSYSTLREMKEGRKQFEDLLRGMKWLDKNDPRCNSNGENEVVVHAVIAAALGQMARIDRAPGDKDTLWHRSIGTTDQQVHVHKSSVNARLPLRLPSRWLVFFEKFATSSRVSISTTAFCSPLSLVLLVGHDFEIQHAERQILLNNWMQLGVAATTAVKLRALRNQLRDLHKEERFVDGVVALLKEDAAAAALWEPSSRV